MSDQTRFPLEQALLGFLMRGPEHGYALHQHAEEEIGRIWYIGISNVYGTLKGLEEAGYVESTLDQENYPPRKVYHITPAGQESFLKWVREPVPAIRDVRVEFLAKLYFFHTLDLEGREGLLSAQEACCHERIKDVERRAASSTQDDFDHLVLAFRRHRIQATLDWLEICRQSAT